MRKHQRICWSGSRRGSRPIGLMRQKPEGPGRREWEEERRKGGSSRREEVERWRLRMSRAGKRKGQDE